MPLPARIDRYSRMARYWTMVGINHLPPNRSRSLFVLGHPRTGTNWFCRILSHYYELPIYLARTFPYMTLQPVVLHLHRFAVVPARTIYLLRDGRDVTVSYYFKLLSSLPRTRPVIRRLEPFCSRPIRAEHVRENLPGFIRFLFEANQTASLPYTQHVREAQRRGLHMVRYEDLITHPEKAVAGAIEYLEGDADAERVRNTVEATSFEQRTGRARGVEDLSAPSVRKGIVGDWTNYFDREAAATYDGYAGELLVSLGYETDRTWVERIPEDRT